jgi:hypothetical protein
MASNSYKPLWILVEVRSGIPVAVESFSDRQSAKIRETQLRKQLNLENDETGIFPVEVNVEPKKSL